jgi:hypothetical protein
MTTRAIEAQLLDILQSSMEDTRIPDAIAAYADQRAGKPVTKSDAEKLESPLGVPVRIQRQHGMTHVSWTSSADPRRYEHQLLLAHSETNVRWPSGAELREKEPAYFRGRDERNTARRKLLNEHQLLTGTPDRDQSTIARTAAAIVKFRAAQEELTQLMAEDVSVISGNVEKLMGRSSR